MVSPPSDHTHHLAFDNSLLPNIISIVSDGKIVAANEAAAHLLGYSKAVLLTKYMEEVIDGRDHVFHRMLMQRSKSGHVIDNISAIRKDGMRLPCQMTSVEFMGDMQIRKAISTLVDLSAGIRVQQKIDVAREKKVDANIAIAKHNSDILLHRLAELEYELDLEISAKKALASSSRVQKLADKKERVKETRLRATQLASAVSEAVSEAQEIQRTDLGMELHDNVNQLLVASRLYLDIAQKNKANQTRYLKRSSDYTLKAIEEIRKLTKGLIKNVLNNLTLSEAADDLIQDLMKVHPIVISWKMDYRIHERVNAKFNLNVFRIIQEQLTNIIKHARASKASIDISRNKSQIILTISDDGSGFDVRKEVDGIGLINIKTRAASFKGRAKLISKKGKGCILRVSFPVAETRNSKA